MKKIKTVIFMTLLGAIALTSCSGSDTHYGRYTFQMGKVNSDHVGIYMVLSDETTTIDVGDEKINAEKFNIQLETPNSSNNEGEDKDESITDSILEYFSEGINGGYTIVKKEEGGYKLNLYPSFGELLEENDAPFAIDSKIMDKILFCDYNGSSVSVTVPVSLTDLMFQLYWYGFDVMNILGEQTLPEHDIGTHPTKEDVEEINKTFNDGILNHPDLDLLVKYGTYRSVNYRDFHALTMSLAKED